MQQESQEIHSSLEAALSSAEPAPASAEETQAKVQAADVNETAELNVKPTELGGGLDGDAATAAAQESGGLREGEREEVAR